MKDNFYPGMTGMLHLDVDTLKTLYLLDGLGYESDCQRPIPCAQSYGNEIALAIERAYKRAPDFAEVRFELGTSLFYPDTHDYAVRLLREGPVPTLDGWQVLTRGDFKDIEIFLVDWEKEFDEPLPEGMRLVREDGTTFSLYAQNSPVKDPGMNTLDREVYNSQSPVLIDLR